MFNIIKSSVTPQQAQEMFPNDYIVLLISRNSMDDDGDVIFVGGSRDRYEFTKKNHPPNGYSFYMLKGVCLQGYDLVLEAYHDI